jgi:hypothetical protein
MTPAALDGHCDALLSLPPQAARRFIEHEIGRDTDWNEFCEQYLESYYRARRSMK